MNLTKFTGACCALLLSAVFTADSNAQSCRYTAFELYTDYGDIPSWAIALGENSGGNPEHTDNEIENPTTPVGSCDIYHVEATGTVGAFSSSREDDYVDKYWFTVSVPAEESVTFTYDRGATYISSGLAYKNTFRVSVFEDENNTTADDAIFCSEPTGPGQFQYYNSSTTTAQDLYVGFIAEGYIETDTYGQVIDDEIEPDWELTVSFDGPSLVPGDRVYYPYTASENTTYDESNFSPGEDDTSVECETISSSLVDSSYFLVEIPPYHTLYGDVSDSDGYAGIKTFQEKTLQSNVGVSITRPCTYLTGSPTAPYPEAQSDSLCETASSNIDFLRYNGTSDTQKYIVQVQHTNDPAEDWSFSYYTAANFANPYPTSSDTVYGSGSSPSIPVNEDDVVDGFTESTTNAGSSYFPISVPANSTVVAIVNDYSGILDGIEFYDRCKGGSGNIDFSTETPITNTSSSNNGESFAIFENTDTEAHELLAKVTHPLSGSWDFTYSFVEEGELCYLPYPVTADTEYGSSTSPAIPYFTYSSFDCTPTPEATEATWFELTVPAKSDLYIDMNSDVDGGIELYNSDCEYLSICDAPAPITHVPFDNNNSSAEQKIIAKVIRPTDPADSWTFEYSTVFYGSSCDEAITATTSEKYGIGYSSTVTLPNNDNSQSVTGCTASQGSNIESSWFEIDIPIIHRLDVKFKDELGDGRVEIFDACSGGSSLACATETGSGTEKTVSHTYTGHPSLGDKTVYIQVQHNSNNDDWSVEFDLIEAEF